MPIVPAEDPPPGVEDAAARIVDELCDGGTISVPDRSKLGVMLGHWVYWLGLEQAAGSSEAEPKGVMEGARRSSWSYLLMDDRSPIGVLSLSVDPDGGAIGFSGLSYGGIVDDLRSAVKQAEADPRVQAGRYELRELRMPGIQKSAVWFKDRDGDADVVIRVGRAPWFPGEEPSSAWRAAARRSTPTRIPIPPGLDRDAAALEHGVREDADGGFGLTEGGEGLESLEERKGSLDDFLRSAIPASRRALEMQGLDRPEPPGQLL